MTKNVFLALALIVSLSSFSQTDEEMLQKIYQTALTEGQSYQWLDHLSNKIGSRLSGSLGAERAVVYTKEIMESLDFDRVFLQPVMVPKWVRGNPEFAYIETAPGDTMKVNICALGGSVATQPSGIKAEVVEVYGLEDLKTRNRSEIEGKIVFFNMPMPASSVLTFQAYGAAVGQRTQGAKEASKLGAVGAIVRSMNLRLDDYPHTGTTSYGDLPKSEHIPTAAISTNDAEKLSSYLKLDSKLKFYFKQNCKTLPDVLSYNVIGEIKGSTYPDEIVLVGGHLDSWDLGDGSHDDGAGCVQSIEVLRLFKKLGIQPKRTLRAVMFMNEENGLRGGTEYAKVAKAEGLNHIFALESDSGGFTPRGFNIDANAESFAHIASWTDLFKPYLTNTFNLGGSGADIGPLKRPGIVLAGLFPDSQRYFDYHHTAIDTFDAINKRELELGAATMASMVYLIDKYGTSN